MPVSIAASYRDFSFVWWREHNIWSKYTPSKLCVGWLGHRTSTYHLRFRRCFPAGRVFGQHVLHLKQLHLSQDHQLEPHHHYHHHHHPNEPHRHHHHNLRPACVNSPRWQKPHRSSGGAYLSYGSDGASEWDQKTYVRTNTRQASAQYSGHIMSHLLPQIQRQ